MAFNLRHGFNRLYIVLACMWAVYCLMIYPMQQREKALQEWGEDKKSCYDSQYGNREGLAQCLKSAEQSFQTGLSSWSTKNFYLGAWKLLFAAIVLLPFIVYAVCRGGAALSLWIWNGFRLRSG